MPNPGPKQARKQALTAVLPVRAGLAQPLASLLTSSGATLRAKLDGVRSLHFARCALLGSGESGAELLFETTFDADARAHLAELWACAGPELSAVFSHCDGWRSPPSFDDFRHFLERGARPSAALFVAHDALSVERIRTDARVRAELARFLDTHDAELRRLTPLELVTRAQTALAVTAPGVVAPRLRSPYVASAPLDAPSSARLALLWLRSALHDVIDVVRELWLDTQPAERAGADTRVTPLGVQCCFSHVAHVKPGRFRRAALRLALRSFGALAGLGTAARTPDAAPAIHAARWLLLEDGRLVFLCNHDGSFATVLGRIARRASVLVSMLWSQTLGFPASFAWFFGGARSEARLRAFAAHGACATPFWYSAYPELGANEVRTNAEIRELLATDLDAGGARRLLALMRD